MNEKLEKLALKMEGLIQKYSSPQEVYYSLMSIVKSQPDYFVMKGPELIIQLTYLIYSYKKTGDFELGKKMLNNNEFIFVLYSSGQNYEETCPSCYGNEGYVNCIHCDGTGEVNCSTCDGTGEVECDKCSGTGDDPYDEEYECDECNGSGIKICWNCNGNETKDCEDCMDGLVSCDDCYGTGVIESEELEYTMEIIMTWDKDLIDDAKETHLSLVPMMSLKQFKEMGNKYVFLNLIDGHHANFKKGFREHEVYCFDYSDNPNLSFSSIFDFINAQGAWVNISRYE